MAPETRGGGTRHPWRVRFADQGPKKDAETRKRFYPELVGAAVKAGELAWRYERTVIIECVTSRDRWEVRPTGQVRRLR